MSLSKVKKKIAKQKNPAQALVFLRFFKTGKSKYVEEYIFYGTKFSE